MGFSTVAAHLIVLVALASAGTLLVTSMSSSYADHIEAQSSANHRQRTAAQEEIDLLTGGFRPAICENDTPPPGCQGTLTPERSYANFTNDGSREIPLDEVTLLVDGVLTPHADVATFEIRSNATTNLWMPGEVLEVMTEGQGDVDIAVLGPHASAAYRRA